MVRRSPERGGSALRTALLLAALGPLACGAPPDGAPAARPVPPAALPAPDLSALEPAVAERVGAAQSEATSALAAAASPPARAAALAGLARVYHAHALAAPARAAYAAALAETPRDPGLLYLAARLELDENRLAEAEALFARAVAADPTDAHAREGQASALRRLGRRAEALAAAEAAAATDPAHGRAWLTLAEAAADAGEPARAAEAYARLFALHPEASKYRAPYAQVLRRAGETAAAETQLALRGEGVPVIVDARLAEVAALRTSHRLDRIDGARMIQTGAVAAGVELLERALAADPDDPEIRHDLAVGLLRLGRTEEAVARFAEAAQLRPQDPGAHFALGTALARIGRAAEAEAAYLAALARDPGHLDARQNLANLRLRAGRFDEALSDFALLRAAAPARAGGWLGGAAAEAALGRERAALAMLEAGLAELPGDWRLESAWCRLASAARDPAVRDGAAATVRARALVARARSPLLLATLAMALAESGDFAGAVAAQEEAMALQAGEPALAARLARDLAGYRGGVPCRDPGLI
ncbi:MAG: tetratricopeptide repeat protein [Thermoanaerobaculia bacterium]|nr:tetratricopeptide repeat protein [Thermoanaerobaculia bacterium]